MFIFYEFISAGVRESLKKSGWADEEDFEVKGSPDADEFLPKKARMNATKQVCFFLQNYVP